MVTLKVGRGRWKDHDAVGIGASRGRKPRVGQDPPQRSRPTARGTCGRLGRGGDRWAADHRVMPPRAIPHPEEVTSVATPHKRPMPGKKQGCGLGLIIHHIFLCTSVGTVGGGKKRWGMWSLWFKEGWGEEGFWGSQRSPRASWIIGCAQSTPGLSLRSILGSALRCTLGCAQSTPGLSLRSILGSALRQGGTSDCDRLTCGLSTARGGQATHWSCCLSEQLKC
jgi:hypothetical protein